MGVRIPDSIRLQIIKKWLEGRSRDKVAQEFRTSQGAVSGIIKEAGINDPQFLLLREVAVKIKTQGMDIESFAPLVRLRAILKDKGVLTGTSGQENLELIQNRLEAAVVTMDEYLFYKGLSFEEFFGLVTNMYDLADKVGVPLQEFPSYIKELKDKIDFFREEINEAEKEKQDFQNDHKETLELLQEYIANKPFVDTLRALKQQVTDAKERMRKLEEELDNERCSKDREKKNSLSVFETELEKAKEEILPGVKYTRFKSIIHEVFRNPLRYPGSIKQMMNIYEENESHSYYLEGQDKWSDFDAELEKAKEEILPRLEIPRVMKMIKGVPRHPERYMEIINRILYLNDGYQEIYPAK